MKRDGQVLGIVTPHEVRSVDRARWTELTVAEVMRPLDSLRTVAPTTPVSDALAVMAREDLNQLPVVVDGRLQGVVTRGNILQLLQSQTELKAA